MFKAGINNRKKNSISLQNNKERQKKNLCFKQNDSYKTKNIYFKIGENIKKLFPLSTCNNL